MNQKNELNPLLWVDDYSDTMYYFALSRVNSAEIAEDLVQDTFFSALKSKDTFKGEATEKTWLYSILKRKIIDYYRKASSRHERNFSQLTPFESEDTPASWKKDSMPKDWDDNNDKQFDADEFSKVLRECLNVLPEKYSKVFELKTMRGFETKEVCKEMDISSSNLWVILHRTRIQLRQCLETNWFLDNKKKL